MFPNCTGATGEAATVKVGSTITGDPGTQAEVTNSGTDENVILDFVIPRGENGGAAQNDVLISDAPSQVVNANENIPMQDNVLERGTSITHTPGTAEFILNEPGVYTLDYHGYVTAPAAANYPVSVGAAIYQNERMVTNSDDRSNVTSATDQEILQGDANIIVREGEQPATIVVRNSTDNTTWNTVEFVIVKIA